MSGDLFADANRLKNLAALIGLDGGNAHLGGDLYDAVQDGVVVVLHGCVVVLVQQALVDELKNKVAGIRTFPTGFEALMKTENISGFPNLTVDPATIDEIVVFTSKKGDDYE